MTRLSETLTHLEKITHTHKQTINETLEKTLHELEKDLQSRFKDVLTILQSDTDSQLQSFRLEQKEVLNETLRSLKNILEETRFYQKEAQSLLLRRWWVPLVTGLALSLALFLGIWGGSTTLTYLLTKSWRLYAENQLDIKEQEKTIKLLKKKTWGITLQELKNGKFIVIPQGYQAEWTCGGKPCIEVGRD